MITKGSVALSEDREPDVRLDRLSPEMRAYAGEALPSGGRPDVAAETETAAGATAAERDPSETAEPGAAAGAEPGAESGAESGAAAGAQPEPGSEAETETAGVEATAATSEDELPRRRHPAPDAPHVLLIGGGATGAALAHDLALRGLRVTLVEKGELVSGTTGRGQGLLDSGARFASTDRAMAIECATENKILRRIAPGSFEENDGLYVAVTDDDADCAAQFLEACWQSAVPTRRLTRERALASEPKLNPELRLAVQVPDATMDSVRLPLRFFATARSNGADIRHFTEVVAMNVAGGTLTGVRLRDRTADREYVLGADLVVNAAGPWAGRVATLAGATLPITLLRGAMLSVRDRHTNMVVSRLQPAGTEDVVVPERQSTILGIDHSPADLPDRALLPDGDFEAVRRRASALVPSLENAALRARWAAVRPVPSSEARRTGPGEMLLVDHGKTRDRVAGLLTVTGGRTTTMRATAERAADSICARLGIERPCETREVVLLPHTAWYSR